MNNPRLVSGGLPAAVTRHRMDKEHFGNELKNNKFNNNIFHIN
jgi:hypothetical protein